jgi:diguanylate cyclase (GGDEF)-like protein
MPQPKARSYDRRRALPEPAKRSRGVYVYVAVIAAAGLGLFAWLAPHGVSGVLKDQLRFWLFVGFVLLGELFPIRLSRRNEEEQIATSTMFIFALLLIKGLEVAVIAQAIASIAADLGARKKWWKAAFNIGQYTLSLWAGSEVLRVLRYQRMTSVHLGLEELAIVLLAAGAFFLVNNFVVGTALAIAQETPVIEYLRKDIVFQITTTGVLLCLSPVVVIAAEKTLFLMPFLLVPLMAIYRSAKVSLEKEHEAMHDVLTDLPNRNMFHDRVEQTLVGMADDPRPIAVILIDLDHFKEINDTLGHHIGDMLLRQVGPRLRSTLRDGDLIARLGGDEFGVLLTDLVSSDDPKNVAGKIVRALDQPFMVEGFTLDIDASMGVALFPEHGQDVDTLMRRADIAMYVAKETHARYEMYAPARDKHSPKRLSLLGDLRHAIDERQLVLYYQPKMEITSGRVADVESLIRWEHPSHGLVMPDEFIPLAEHTGLIAPLTSFVLDSALAQHTVWREKGVNLGVGVNISVRNLFDPNFATEVAEAIQKWGINPAVLELEITESTLMADPQRALDVLMRLSALGVRLALDDFGIGYSSLAHLKRLPVNVMKIDKSFVMNMAHDEDDAVIVQSTIDLARSLGLEVVAEGVENQEALSRLAEMGCDIAQGYYLTRPLPPDQLESWLTAAKKLPDAQVATLPRDPKRTLFGQAGL